MSKSFDKQLERVLVFGASGHIGRPLASWAVKAHPEVALRLATSRADAQADLKDAFPGAEVVVCSYYDTGQLQSAMDGVEGVFMVTPDFTREVEATGNLIRAAEAAGSVRHVVRIMGDPPGVTLEDVPPSLRSLGDGMGAAVGHQAARRLLTASSLAVTFLNSNGYYMDDLSGQWYGDAIREKDSLCEPRRHHMFYLDPAELGEAAARILLRRDVDDIGKTHEMHNAVDVLDFRDVAEMLTAELGRPITYVEGAEPWRRGCGPAVIAKYGAGADQYFVEYFNWEAEMLFTIVERDVGRPARWVLDKGPRWLQHLAVGGMVRKGEHPISHDLERILGRKPRLLREWVRANTSAFDRPARSV